MSEMEKIPTFLRRPIFQKLFDIAEYSKMDKKEKEMYDLSLKKKWDEKVILDQVREEGLAEGIEKQERKFITNLIKKGHDDTTIVSLTESSLELVRAVRAELDRKVQ